jgi:hypothetical protein
MNPQLDGRYPIGNLAYKKVDVRSQAGSHVSMISTSPLSLE